MCVCEYMKIASWIYEETWNFIFLLGYMVWVCVARIKSFFIALCFGWKFRVYLYTWVCVCVCRTFAYTDYSRIRCVYVCEMCTGNIIRAKQVSVSVNVIRMIVILNHRAFCIGGILNRGLNEYHFCHFLFVCFFFAWHFRLFDFIW